MIVEQIIGHSAEKWPQRVAIIEQDQSVSYSELLHACELMQNTLQQAGIKPGMGLAVLGRNSTTFIVAMLSGMACGATVLPVSSQLKQAEIEQIIKDTGLHAVLDDGSGVQFFQDAAINLCCRGQKLNLYWTGQNREQAITPLADAAFIRYTSGTTGICKGVVLTKQRILERVQIAQQALSIQPGDGVLWVLSMAYHFLVTILVYLTSGARILLCRDLLASTLIDTANQYNARLLYASPMHYRLLAADQSGKVFNTLQRAISTSSAIPVAIADAFKRRFDIPVIQAYGIIEAGLPLLDDFSDQARPDSVGFPVKGFEVALLDQQGRPIKDGRGRLAVRGAGMFNAYLNPWQDAQLLNSESWFYTGDLAQWGADGRLEICGREKSMINVSGNKAFPEEIEAVLNSHDAIKDSRVFAAEHPLMGEVASAEVVLEQYKECDVEAILSYCRQRLSTYKIPQRLTFVDEITQTASGKVKR